MAEGRELHECGKGECLLKAHGHQGPYALVSLGKTTAHPDGAWRFVNVQIPDQDGGGQRTYSVEVLTGRVEEESHWRMVRPSMRTQKDLRMLPVLARNRKRLL